MTVNHPATHFTETAAATRPIQVSFEGVTKVYRPRGGAAVEALAGIDLAVRTGEVFGIIGRSGAGKSSLIRLINGLERPTGGRVVVEGVDVGTLPEPALTPLRRRIGMIFQGFNLMAARSVEDNVALPLRFAGVGRREARRRAAEALDLVGLADKAKAYPGRLSGGQKQRAGIARALVQKPTLLLSDEATSALDPETTRSILDLLRTINRDLGLTIVLITHEMEVVRGIADRVAVIDAGRIVETGPTWRVFGDPVHAVTRTLLRRAGDRTDLPDLSGDTLLLALAYTGRDAREVDLGAVVGALGPGARLVQADLERIQGRSQGRLFVAVPRPSAAETQALLTRAHALASHVEIVRDAP